MRFHNEIPTILGITGLSRGEFFKPFTGFHEETHAGCEEALLRVLFLSP